MPGIKKDGPLSLQGSNSNIMETSTSSSTNMSNQNSAPSKVMSPTSPPCNQINGKVENGPTHRRRRSLSMEQVMDKVTALVTDFIALDDYTTGEAMKIQKTIGDFYWDYTKWRSELGDTLCAAGYPAATVKMLKALNAVGIFKNDSIWFPTYYAYNTMWNYSDASLSLAKNLAESDAVRLLTLNCGHKPYINAIHSKNVYYVMKASLSTLNNIAKNPDAKVYFKENKTAEVIRPFISSSTDEMLKALSMLTLAYIVEEEENSSLIEETGTIKSVVEWLGKSIDNPKRRYKGFTPQELVQGLDKLAVNDSNKSRIIDEDAMPLFYRMLQQDDVREQSTAARTLWTLSFDKTVQEKIKEYEGLVPTLEKLQEHSDKSVSKNAKGALWIIKGENDQNTSSRQKSALKTKNHIFLSYSWSDKETAMVIRDRLRAEGYNVWIDIERSGGSTLQAMAEAVENSAVVLMCMSEKYKQSPNCRTEAEYTFQLRKDYIPLMMQKRYRPDGWLGAILGAKLFFDFSGKYPVEKSFQGLLKELRGRGQGASSPSGDVTDGATTSDSTSPAYASPMSNQTEQSPTTPTSSSGNHMSHDDVHKWLLNQRLDGCAHSFSQFDGRLLFQFKEMKREAPEFFYNCLDKKLNLSLIDILKFTDALDRLKF